VFIFDSLRPVSHNNVLTQKAVYVVDFGDIDVGECPEDADFEAVGEEEGADEEVVDGEKEYQIITKGGKVEESKGEDSEVDEELIGKKRKREEGEEEDRVRRMKRVNEYYAGSYYSKSCAYLVY
jgi:hypothetical protein